MYIVFSQVFPWSETGRKDESGEPISCSDMFPNMMLISGCLQIAFVFEEMINGVLLACLAAEPDEAKAKKIFAVKYCFALALLVINIMMWVYLFQSGKECGPELWNLVSLLLSCHLFKAAAMEQLETREDVNDAWIQPQSRFQRQFSHNYDWSDPSFLQSTKQSIVKKICFQHLSAL